MADVIENRVVEMDFDNRGFEEGVDESLKSIDRLNKALEFKGSTKGFEKIQNAIEKVNFDSISDATKNIEKSFTTLAGSLERNFFDTISNRIISLGEEFASSTIGQIISGGKARALNIEAAKFKIKGMKGDWDAVYKDMDYAVSGTAYGIDSAANAAAQFLASGVKAGNDMKAALRGISGIAAMTSSTYEDIADIFTSAAGKGRVQAMELNRIAQRGVNASAELAKAMNTTESEVRAMATKGQISFNMFAKAMDDAFGEHAKKANETFEGSLANMKAALSRIGEIWFTPWLEALIPVFNDLRTVIDQYKNALKTPMDSSGNTIATALRDVMTAGSEAFQAFIQTWDPWLKSLPFMLEDVFNGLNKLADSFEFVRNVFLAFKEIYMQEKVQYTPFDAIQNEARQTGKSVEWVDKKIEEFIKEKEEALDTKVIEEIQAQVEKSSGDVGMYMQLLKEEYEKAEKAAEDFADAQTAVTDSISEMTAEEQLYWQAYSLRKLFDAPGIQLKDFYNQFVNVSNDIATVTSSLGKNTVTWTKTTALSVAEAIDKYQTVWDSYHNALESTMNVYTRWNTNYTLTFKKLQSNLASNKKGLTQLAKDMATLTKKGASKELLDELKSQGASGAELVHALAGASKKELAQYEKDRKEVKDLQKKTTDEWTSEERKKYEETISKLVGFSGTSVDEAKKMYNQIFKDMGMENAQSYSEGVSAVYSNIENTITSLEKTMDKYESNVDFGDATESVAETIEKEEEETNRFADFYEDFLEIVARIRADYPGIFDTLDSVYQVFQGVVSVFSGVWHVVSSIFELIGEGFKDVFSAFGPTAYNLADLLNNLGYALESIDFNGPLADSIIGGFRGIFSIVELGRYIFESFLGFLNSVFFPNLEEGSEQTVPFILRLFGAVGDFIYEIVQLIEMGGSLPEILQRIGQEIGGLFESLADGLSGNGEGLGIGDFLYNIIDTIMRAFDYITSFTFGNGESTGLFGSIVNILFGDGESRGILTAISAVVEELIWGVQSGTGAISSLFDAISGVISSMGNVLSGQSDNISRFLDDMFGFIHAIFVALSKEEDGGVTVVKNVFVSVFTVIKDVLDTIAETLENISQPGGILETITRDFTLILDSIAYMVSKVSQWVGDDPEHAYGAAAFFVLMGVLFKFSEEVGAIFKMFYAITGALLSAKRILNQGFMVGVQETFFDKMQKIGIAIGAIAAGIGILIYGVAKLYEITSKDESGMMIDSARIFIVSILGVILGFVVVIVSILSKMLYAIQGGARTMLAGGGVAAIFTTMTLFIVSLFASLAIFVAVMTGLVALAGPNAIIAIAAAVVFMLEILGLVGLLFAMLTDAMAYIANGERSVAPAMFGIAAMLLTLGIGIGIIFSGISFMILALTGAMSVSAYTGKSMGGIIVLVIVTLLEIFAGIFAIIVISTKAAEELAHYKATKQMIAIAAFIILFSIALNSIVLSIAELIAAFSLSKSGWASTAAIVVVGLIGLVLGELIGFIAEISKDMPDTNKLVITVLAMALMVNAFAFAMNQVLLGLIALNAVNLKESTIDVFMTILVALGILMAAMLAIFAMLARSMGSSAFGYQAFMAIAAGMVGISLAIYLVAKAVNKLTFALIALAYMWPKISKTLPQMLQDIHNLLPMLGQVFGDAVDELCTAIITRAPKIAQALVTIVILAAYLFAQKAPIMMSIWLLRTAEMLDIFLSGLDLLGPKILAIIWWLLDFLGDNAFILSYQLTKILLSIIGGALAAIWDTLVDFFDFVSDPLSEFFLWIEDQLSILNWNISNALSGIADEWSLKVTGRMTVEWIKFKNRVKHPLDDVTAAKESVKEINETVPGYKARFTTNPITGIATVNADWDNEEYMNDFAVNRNFLEFTPFSSSYDYASNEKTFREQVLDANDRKLDEKLLKQIKATENVSDVEIGILTALIAAAGGGAIGAVKAIGKGSIKAGLAAGVAKGVTVGGTTLFFNPDTNKWGTEAMGSKLDKDPDWTPTFRDKVDEEYSASKQRTETTDKVIKAKEDLEYKIDKNVGSLSGSLGDTWSDLTGEFKDLWSKIPGVTKKSGTTDELSNKLAALYKSGASTEDISKATSISVDEIKDYVSGKVGSGVSINPDDVNAMAQTSESDEQMIQAFVAQYGGGNAQGSNTEVVTFGDGEVLGTENMDYNTYDFIPEEYKDVMSNVTGGEGTGVDAITSGGLLSVLGGNGDYIASDYDTSGSSYAQYQSLANAMAGLQQQMENLMMAIGNSIIMPQDASINTTMMIDNTELGRVQYPVIKSLMDSEEELEDLGIVTATRPAAALGNPGLTMANTFRNVARNLNAPTTTTTIPKYNYGSPDFKVKLR